jgi:phosphatidylglycerol:prolipoprotein diacylglycerol transferase
MIQELFSIGSFSISPFGVMLVVALLAAYAQLVSEMRRLGIGGEDDASAIVVGCGLAGIAGGKVYYAALYGDWRLVFDRSGIVWYGCFLAGLATFLWLVRRRGLPFGRTLDAGALCLALAYGIGRIGCFLVGDDYGKPTDLPWGVAFKKGIPATTARNLEEHFGIEPPPGAAPGDFVAVHPTQVYETLAALGIWIFLRRLARRDLRPGTTFLTGVSLLSLERFLIEFLRAKDDRFFGELTLAQVISLAVLLTMGAVALLRFFKAPEAAEARAGAKAGAKSGARPTRTG